MKILRKIQGVTLRDRRSADIRRECKVKDVIKWTKKRKKEWNDYVSRMNNERMAKICRGNQLNAKRSSGRPPKRWAESWQSSSIE